VSDHVPFDAWKQSEHPPKQYAGCSVCSMVLRNEIDEAFRGGASNQEVREWLWTACGIPTLELPSFDILYNHKRRHVRNA
jgi:hypothetical protein